MNTSRVILHVDADAFFASCEQAIHPEWKGKPVVCKGNQGTVIAMSYEAKRFGIVRGMTVCDVRHMCPVAIIVSADYDVYTRFAMRMFAIIRRYVGTIEEYSIDEAFADITDVPTSLSMTYEQLLQCIQEDIWLSLGISVSLGCAPTKTLAKIASAIKKPHGCLAMPTMKDVRHHLYDIAMSSVWGIEPHHVHNLKIFGIQTVKDFVSRGELFIKSHFDSSICTIYRELKGMLMYEFTIRYTTVI